MPSQLDEKIAALKERLKKAPYDAVAASQLAALIAELRQAEAEKKMAEQRIQAAGGSAILLPKQIALEKAQVTASVFVEKEPVHTVNNVATKLMDSVLSHKRGDIVTSTDIKDMKKAAKEIVANPENQANYLEWKQQLKLLKAQQKETPSPETQQKLEALSQAVEKFETAKTVVAKDEVTKEILSPNRPALKKLELDAMSQTSKKALANELFRLENALEKGQITPEQYVKEVEKAKKTVAAKDEVTKEILSPQRPALKKVEPDVMPEASKKALAKELSRLENALEKGQITPEKYVKEVEDAQKLSKIATDFERERAGKEAHSDPKGKAPAVSGSPTASPSASVSPSTSITASPSPRAPEKVTPVPRQALSL